MQQEKKKKRKKSVKTSLHNDTCNKHNSFPMWVTCWRGANDMTLSLSGTERESMPKVVWPPLFNWTWQPSRRGDRVMTFPWPTRELLPSDSFRKLPCTDQSFHTLKILSPTDISPQWTAEPTKFLFVCFVTDDENLPDIYLSAVNRRTNKVFVCLLVLSLTMKICPTYISPQWTAEPTKF